MDIDVFKGLAKIIMMIMMNVVVQNCGEQNTNTGVVCQRNKRQFANCNTSDRRICYAGNLRAIYSETEAEVAVLCVIDSTKVSTRQKKRGVMQQWL